MGHYRALMPAMSLAELIDRRLYAAVFGGAALSLALAFSPSSVRGAEDLPSPTPPHSVFKNPGTAGGPGGGGPPGGAQPQPTQPPAPVAEEPAQELTPGGAVPGQPQEDGSAVPAVPPAHDKEDTSQAAATAAATPATARTAASGMSPGAGAGAAAPGLDAETDDRGRSLMRAGAGVSRPLGARFGLGSVNAGLQPVSLFADISQWVVPAAAIGGPGLLVLLVALGQLGGGASWLPVTRRVLGTFGVRRR